MGCSGLEKYHGKDINLTEALTLEATREMEKAVDEKSRLSLYVPLCYSCPVGKKTAVFWINTSRWV